MYVCLTVTFVCVCVCVWLHGILAARRAAVVYCLNSLTLRLPSCSLARSHPGMCLLLIGQQDGLDWFVCVAEKKPPTVINEILCLLSEKYLNQRAIVVSGGVLT